MQSRENAYQIYIPTKSESWTNEGKSLKTIVCKKTDPRSSALWNNVKCFHHSKDMQEIYMLFLAE